MLLKCFKCVFNVRISDEFCLNCGLKKPSEKVIHLNLFSQKPLLLLQISIFCLVFALIINALTPVFNDDNSRNLFILFWTLVFGFVFGISFHYLIISKLNKINIGNRFLFNKENLIDRNKIISKRMTELSLRINKITTVSDRIGISTSQNLQGVQQKLVYAKATLGNQFLRYKLQQSKIEFIRMQNNIFPYLERIQILDEFQTENGLVTTQETIKKLNSIQQELNREFPPEMKSEKEYFLQQLMETTKSCQILCEVLLSKQAFRALQEVRPTENTNLISNSEEISHAAETFNIQTILTDFSESFEKLESEYQRILDESEVSQNLLSF